MGLQRKNWILMEFYRMRKYNKLTTINFPAFSSLFAILIAAAAAAPDDIPTCKNYDQIKNSKDSGNALK